MKKGLTQMVFILDMSGSMNHLKNDTIGGFNAMIEEQKKEPGEARITTALFDDRYILLHDGVDIKEVPPMTEKDYMPLGLTALLDAVGKTINTVGQQLSAMAEEERPEKVIVTIVTDGMENASKEFTWKSIKEMITHQREKYNWVFTFIGANIDTMKVGNDLGIDSRLSKTYIPSEQGTEMLFSATSKSMTFTRGVENISLNCSATIDSLSDILDEVEKAK